MLVGANHGAVDMMEAPIERPLGIRLPLEIRQDPVPDTGTSPAIEAGGDRLPRAVLLREIPPRRSGSIEPQQAIDDLAMIFRGATASCLLRWEQRPQPLPLLVSQISSAHTESLPSLALFENRT